MPPTDSENSKQKNKRNWLLNIILITGFIFLFILYFLLSPSANKDVGIHITEGSSISSVADKLENERSVRSSFTLKIFVELLKSRTGIISGDYLIKKNSPVWVVAWQIARGYHNIAPVKIILREGLTNDQMTAIFADKLSAFRRDLFLTETEDKQGYLFPDTYFMYPGDTTAEIINKLSGNFNYKIKNILPAVEKSGKGLNKIITMASILEGEAGGKDDIGMISGILWKRIEKGIPLQVDVVKSTYEDKGLPPNPINNPGIQSINAALNPIDSPYLYYLHDKSGGVHYAKTFDEHKSNIKKYLK